MHVGLTTQSAGGCVSTQNMGQNMGTSNKTTKSVKSQFAPVDAEKKTLILLLLRLTITYRSQQA